MIGYADLRFEERERKMLHGKKETGYSIVPFEIPGMWCIKFPNGNISTTFYNITWAKENCKEHYLAIQNKGLASPVDALK